MTSAAADATVGALEVDAIQRGRVGDGNGLSGGSARSLLLTMLGELVWQSEQPAWTSALLYVMNGLGVEERTARQAIARAANAGWIEAQRHGREARWVLTPQLIKVYEEGEPRVLSLSDPFTEWDGQWLVLFVTVPHELRSVRKRLYGDLEWAGFGNPIAGVWLSPHSERREQVAATIADLGLADSTMSFLGGIDQIGLDEARVVQSGWDLAGLERTYAAVAEDVAALHPEPGDETLVAHLRMLAALRRFPYSDPQLPEALLPDWVGRRVVSQIVGLREKWNSEVRARWREINAAN